MLSCIYEGNVRHRRAVPIAHEFRYALFMLYLDLDELPQLLKGGFGLSRFRFSPVHPLIVTGLQALPVAITETRSASLPLPLPGEGDSIRWSGVGAFPSAVRMNGTSINATACARSALSAKGKSQMASNRSWRAWAVSSRVEAVGPRSSASWKYRRCAAW